MDWIYRYYGVDWMVFVLVVIHLWLLGNKRKSAFLVGSAGCCFGFLFGFLVESLASMMMNIVFLLMHVRAYLKWGEKELEIYEGFHLKLAEDTWPDDIDFGKENSDHRA